LGPYPISAASLASLLYYVRSAARRPLTASELAKVFGPGCAIASMAVSGFYNSVSRAQRRTGPSRTKTFMGEWERLFGVIYGQELQKAEAAANETAGAYQIPGGARLKPLLFSIHTYYALLMKLIAIELVALQQEKTVVSFVKGLSELSDEELRERLRGMESGAEFSARQIENFLEADFFSWYLDDWNPNLVQALRQMIQSLFEFEPATPILEPEWTRDLLQNLYELIVPQKLRHNLGEYYTPDWLAGYLVDRSGYDGAPESRFLDPACGSGTFLVQAIDRASRHARGQSDHRVREIGEKILNNIVGFDLNPLAVLAARTNYLIAFSRFLPFVRPVVIPVYLCDSVLTPSRVQAESQANNSLRLERPAVYKTIHGDFTFPSSIKDKSLMDEFSTLVDQGLHSGLEAEKFSGSLAVKMNLPPKDRDRLVEVYRKIKALEDNGENGLWAKYLKNAFAPDYMGRFDFVIGNPPWIRWGYLSAEYREETLKLWQGYGLFSLTGHQTRLGAGEKDFSMLFTYACADNYLKEGGTLAFVITLEVFKSKGAGEGFRSFYLPENKVPLKLLFMEDMVDVKPFYAANKTSIFALQKGKPTTYPVPVVQWKRKPRIGKVNPRSKIEEVQENTIRKNLLAFPVDPTKPSSSWQTAQKKEFEVLNKLKGEGHYKAYAGAYAVPYGVFWLRVLEVLPNRMLLVENLFDRGKWEIEKVKTRIEPDLVFPAVSGGEITRFGIKEPFSVLLPQNPETRKGYDEDFLLSNCPLTHAYLYHFKDVLVKRAAYQKYFHKEVKKGGKLIKKEAIAPFWSMYNISKLSFAHYRVTWKRMASRMTVAVLSRKRTDWGTKAIISTDTTSFIPVEDRGEAHYLCAVLNSEVVDRYIRSYSAAGRGFGTPSVVENLAIPRYNAKSKLHRELAELSEQAHEMVVRGAEVSKVEKRINAKAEELWNIKS
jgi:type I restriction-modification system DNA methylase subunit